MTDAPRPSPPPRVSRAAASRAVNSLLKWIRAHRHPNNIAATALDDSIFLILTLTKTPHKLQSKPYRIALPHPLHDAATVSLILDDRPNSLFTLSTIRDLVLSLALPISRILSLSDVRSGILPGGELLLADRRIARFLRGFEKKGRNKKSGRNMPVEVDFTRSVWPEYLRRVCYSTAVNLGSGTCSGIRVGRASQGSDVILDNLMAAVDGAVRNVPRKWLNVMGFHLKVSESLALPIYEKSNWTQKKLGDEDDDDGEGTEEGQGTEIGKGRKMEKRKRGRNESELDGGEVRKMEKMILRYDDGR